MNISVVNANQSRMYTVQSSPNNNNIRFIKNKTLNTRSKRVYATAEVFFHKKIPSTILKYMQMKDIKEEEAAYLNYIETKRIPVRTRHSYSPNTFTVLFNENNAVNESNNTRKKYYNEKKGTYTLVKGYGRRLIEYIEESLRREGIRYILLTPSNKGLYKYYTELHYIMDTTGEPNQTTENNQKNEKRVPENIVMYKDLEADEVAV